MSESFKHPLFNRVVGSTPEIEQHTSELKDYIDWLVYERGGKKIEECELDKTPHDQEIITTITGEVDNILRHYGHQDVMKVPENNVHLLKIGGVAEWTEGRLAEGAHSTTRASILIDRCESDVQFASILFHELLHLKPYKALQIIAKDDGKHDVVAYRNGISVVSRDGNIVYLTDLEEAVISYLETRFIAETLPKLPVFRNLPKEQFKAYETSRDNERGLLIEFATKIFEKTKPQFDSVDAVIDVFIRAHITGNLLPIARLVESVFGKGSFRKLGEGDYEYFAK